MQEMTLDEYEAMLAEKNPKANKDAPKAQVKLVYLIKKNNNYAIRNLAILKSFHMPTAGSSCPILGLCSQTVRLSGTKAKWSLSATVLLSLSLHVKWQSHLAF